MTLSGQHSTFKRSGLAALSDIASPEYQKLFALLEKEQELFLSKESSFRSPDYKWPRDPLHCWSRIWEYPYVYYHLRRAKETLRPEISQRVVDLGSGVTFFPFAVARLGYHVQCLDIDPICEHDLLCAASVVSHQPGKVEFFLVSNDYLPLGDKEIDIVYCISVLEHIANFELPIQEVARILKPGGLFILTIDLDLCGYMEIGVRRYQDMRRCLAAFFDLEQPEVTIHPMDMLVQYPFISWFRQVKFQVRQWARAFLGRTRHRTYPNLTVWGGVMRKRIYD